MTKPVTIPNTFATATTAIPLSQLDSDFSTVATALNDANTYSNYAADTGVANAYVVTLTGVSTTYSAGLRIQFKAGNANTGASTLNVNGGGTKNITFQDASALSSGTIAANAIVDVMYDGTQFLLMNDPAGTVGTGDVVGPAGATANAIVRFDSTTGKLVKNSVVTIADSTGDMSGVGAFTATGNVSFDGGTFVFNESGADKDFRIEGDTEPNLFFTDASTDRVGIGTSSPGAQLQLNKTGTGDYTTFRLSNSGTSGKTYEIGVGGNAAAADYANNLYFYDSTAGALRMTLNSSGNLGLGVTPSAWTSDYKIMQLGSTGSIGGHTSTSLPWALVNANYYINSAGNPLFIQAGYAPRYILRGDNGTHSWWTTNSGAAAGAVNFTQAMTLDASGNLGVGTSSPIAIGAGYTSVTVNGSTSGRFDVLFNGTHYAAFQADSGGAKLLAQGASNPLVLGTNNTERARITSGGNVGIGTSSPGALLEVLASGGSSAISARYSTGASSLALYIYNDGTNAYIDSTAYGAGSGGPIVFRRNGSTESARITSGGDFFIGNGETAASPSAGILSATGGTGTNIAGANLTIRGGASTGSGAGGAIIFSTAAAGASGTTVRSASERVRITSDGNLLVGTTSLLDNANYFAYSPGNAWGVFGHANGTASGTEYVKFYYNNGQIGSITQNGTTAVAYNTSSDYRLKDNPQPLTGSGTFIDALKPKTWNWKADGSRGVGFIAHEVQEVSPGSVSGEKDGEQMQAMEYGSAEFIANIIAELQSLRQRVAELEGK